MCFMNEKVMKNKFLPVLLLVVSIGLGGGCALYEGGPATGASDGSSSYIAGTLKTSEATPFDLAITAVLAGLKDLNYAVVDKTGDNLTAKIVARAPGDNKITVTLEKISGTVTDISIRVNTFGDENYSNAIMDAIKRHL